MLTPHSRRPREAKPALPPTMTKTEAKMVLRGDPRARAIAERVLAAGKRVAAKRAPRKRQERADDRAASELRQAMLRKVFSRGGFLCELGEHSVVTEQVDPHHLEGGSGKRRQRESEVNVIRACRVCHDAYHANPAAFVEAVKRWCAAWGYPLPNRKVFR